ncbi:MAG TPA: hypothetical protein VEY71_03305 [Chitinophagales bacterium]|nr:hypothetical protein [Chitinophagales bacterium]
MKSLLCTLLFMAAFFQQAVAQSSLRDTSVSGLLVGFSYGYQFPLADMAERFGNNGLVGTEITYKLRNNFTFGAEAGLIFGRSVNQAGFLDSLMTPDGYFMGYNGLYGNIALYERGFNFSGNVGKIIPVFNANPNSGVYIRLGAGFLQHKIKITDTEETLYPLNGEYVKGYDRLSNGLMLSQYVGFLHLDPRHFVNFHVGLLVQEGFTQNRRSWNFDERRKETEKRLDVLVGLRGTWILPFYGKADERKYTN